MTVGGRKMLADIKGSDDGSAESLSICRGTEVAAALAQAPQVLLKPFHIFTVLCLCGFLPWRYESVLT